MSRGREDLPRRGPVALNQGCGLEDDARKGAETGRAAGRRGPGGSEQGAEEARRASPADPPPPRVPGATEPPPPGSLLAPERPESSPTPCDVAPRVPEHARVVEEGAAPRRLRRVEDPLRVELQTPARRDCAREQVAPAKDDLVRRGEPVRRTAGVKKDAPGPPRGATRREAEPDEVSRPERVPVGPGVPAAAAQRREVRRGSEELLDVEQVLRPRPRVVGSASRVAAVRRTPERVTADPSPKAPRAVPPGPAEPEEGSEEKPPPQEPVVSEDSRCHPAAPPPAPDPAPRAAPGEGLGSPATPLVAPKPSSADPSRRTPKRPVNSDFQPEEGRVGRDSLRRRLGSTSSHLLSPPEERIWESNTVLNPPPVRPVRTPTVPGLGGRGVGVGVLLACRSRPRPLSGRRDLGVLTRLPTQNHV